MEPPIRDNVGHSTHMTPQELFSRWFVAPVQALEKMDRGDGAFVALMSVLPLYERAVVARLKLAGVTATDDAIKAEVERDLGIRPGVRAKFWAIFRNGFMHQGMGLGGKTKWRISGSCEHFPTLLTKDGIDYICIDPWKFASHVFKMFSDTPALITAAESFPFASIFEHE